MIPAEQIKEMKVLVGIIIISVAYIIWFNIRIWKVGKNGN